MRPWVLSQSQATPVWPGDRLAFSLPSAQGSPEWKELKVPAFVNVLIISCGGGSPAGPLSVLSPFCSALAA